MAIAVAVAVLAIGFAGIFAVTKVGVLSSSRTLENLHHLLARVPTRTQDNRGNRHVKLIRDRLHHSSVGGTTHRGPCNPNLQHISVPTSFRARRAGVHSNRHHPACPTLS